MKLEDLMIGDWVHCHMRGCRGHVVDFIDLSNEEVGADGEIYDIDSLEPILLTEEILEKNGFLKDSGGEDLWICDDITVDLVYLANIESLTVTFNMPTNSNTLLNFVE